MICRPYGVKSISFNGRSFKDLRGYKTIFMLNSAVKKNIMLINVKMPTNVGILTYISMINTTCEGLKATNFFISWYLIFMSS